MPIVQMDYSFISVLDDKDQICYLLGVDAGSGALITIFSTVKGPKDAYAVTAVRGWLDFLGHAHIVLQIDTEAALMAVADKLVELRPKTVKRGTPRGSKGSLRLAEGAHNRVKGQVWTLKSVLETKLKGVIITPNHVLAPWLVRHAG